MVAHELNEKLTNWVREWTSLLGPAQVHWCDGSDAERLQMLDLLVEAGTVRRLS